MFKLLLVDDDRAILEMLALTVHRPEVEVITASTEQEAYDHLCDHVIDAAVLDVHLSSGPAQEGLRVLQFLRIQQPPVPVIVISGSQAPYLLNRAYFLGASYFMSKPLDVAGLERQLRMLGLPPRHPSPRRFSRRLRFLPLLQWT